MIKRRKGTLTVCVGPIEGGMRPTSRNFLHKSEEHPLLTDFWWLILDDYDHYSKGKKVVLMSFGDDA
jgi:hypothetical protein